MSRSTPQPRDSASVWESASVAFGPNRPIRWRTGRSSSGASRPSTCPRWSRSSRSANGYLGVRGTPEEGTPVYEPGAVLNGFHETWPIVYPEDAYGLARTGQTIVNATDGSIIRLFVDDEPFDLGTARLVRFRRTLDMQIGVLHREVEFETARGRRIAIRSRRLASLEHRHLVAMDYEVVALDEQARIAISSELVTHGRGVSSDDPRRGNGHGARALVPMAARADERRAVLELKTRNSRLTLACGMEHEIDCSSDVTTHVNAQGDGAQLVVLANLRPGESLRLASTSLTTGRSRRPTATWSPGWTARSITPRARATT